MTTNLKLGLIAKLRKHASRASHPVKNMDIENALLKGFTDRHKAGVHVTSKAIKQRAIHLHKKSGSQFLKVSQGWFQQFKKHHSRVYTCFTTCSRCY